MNIEEIIAKISNERQTPGRFPSRLIFVRNFDEYLTLVDELRSVCDAVFDLAQFTKGDILPRFKDLNKELAKYPGKQLLLLSFGEYLRICIKRELNKVTSAFPPIWEQQQSENSTTKYIIPVFGSREIFDLIVPIQDERQSRFIWELNQASIESDYNLAIYSSHFTDVIQVDAENLQEWLEKWTSLYSDSTRNHFSLRTNLYRYSESVYGSIRINIIDEPFDYVASLVKDGEKLKKEHGDEAFWKYVAKHVKQGEFFASTIKDMLNLGYSFDPVSVLAQFRELPEIKRNLILLWYKLYPSDDYYNFAMSKISTTSEIATAFRDAIFQLTNVTDDYIRQRTAALRQLEVPYNEDYFAKLDKIASPETRLMMLTYRTIAERSYAIKTVSGLLRSGADITSVAEIVRAGYPDLAEYLNPTMTFQNEVSQYFNWYRQSKLVNRPTTDIPCIIDFDDVESRNRIMQQNVRHDSISFWVDGLGAEWLPVLISKLSVLNIDILITWEVTKALIPTETEYNRKWGHQDEKWDRLDKLSHDGMPDDKDYFLCIARQLEIMNEITERIKVLLSKANRVILTGDHGSSRLAALLFHDDKNFAVEPPKNSTVRAFGRYVELNDRTKASATPSMEYIEQDGKRFIVMKTYEHFKQSGNAAGGNTDDNAIAGEVHGGMTPEEYLVPVIVISRRIPLEFDLSAQKSKGITINDETMGLP